MYVWFCSVEQEVREGEKERLEAVGLRVGGCNWSKGLRILGLKGMGCSIAMLMLLRCGAWLVVFWTLYRRCCIPADAEEKKDDDGLE